MEEIDKCYKILNVKKSDSFHKVRKSYNILMLKLHPSRPSGRNHRNYFREVVLAFDLLSKLHKYSNDFSKSDREIYNEWLDMDKSFALEKVDQYSSMKFKDYEKEFLPGCFSISKAFLYFIYLIVAIVAVDIPIEAYKNGEIPGFYLFYLSIGFTIPLIILIYKTIVDEKYITRRFWERCRLEFYLIKHRLRRERINSAFNNEREETTIISETKILKE